MESQFKKLGQVFVELSWLFSHVTQSNPFFKGNDRDDDKLYISFISIIIVSL